MKYSFVIAFLLFSNLLFCQKKVVKRFESDAKEIEISTIGLDDFVIENSNSNYIEITLFAENPNEKHILFNADNKIVKIEFIIEELKSEETIFRKFITERLQRASAIIKIPKGKEVSIFGNHINIESKNYQGNLAVYIDEGIVKLNEIKENAIIKMYEGNIYATLKNTNIDVISKVGKIVVDDILYEKTYQKKSVKNQRNFTISSLKANIFLTTENTQ